MNESREWIRQEFSSEKVVDADNLKAGIMDGLIEARNEQGITQQKLEEMSGVRQPVIARLETGKTSPKLDTVLRLLAPLGKTLAVVPLE